ncbi:GNAT family N-acetyltransferase [Candidatus Dojkabacteria bacterium]|nr:GNAT family N-acetyltransferase [Candidatus Dojkabacteria bacterium]
MISYIQYSKQYLPSIQKLILHTIDVQNSKDYSRETVEIMKDWQNLDRLSNKISKGTYYLAINEGQEVIGIGGLVGEEICTMFVHPDYSKQGIGKTILEKLETSARVLRINKIYLSSTLTAEKFYVNCGFTKIRQALHKLDGNDFKAIEMEKTLN